VPARTARKVRKINSGASAKTADKAASPTLSGPLARSLLARRLAARKSAPSSDGGKAQRPLRVK
jgi:hypothetical protein